MNNQLPNNYLLCFHSNTCMPYHDFISWCREWQKPSNLRFSQILSRYFQSECRCMHDVIVIGTSSPLRGWIFVIVTQSFIVCRHIFTSYAATEAGVRDGPANTDCHSHWYTGSLYPAEQEKIQGECLWRVTSLETREKGLLAKFFYRLAMYINFLSYSNLHVVLLTSTIVSSRGPMGGATGGGPIFEVAILYISKRSNYSEWHCGLNTWPMDGASYIRLKQGSGWYLR